MHYQDTKINFISNREIKNKADDFRLKFWGNKVPVGVEKIIEIKLKIDIIPIPEMLNQCGMDAQITSDFSAIYVDQKSYENNTTRFRFSLAHELGHFVLHKKFYDGLEISDLEDVMDFINNINLKEYGHLETQANKFASYFLLPREHLAKVREKTLKEMAKGHDISKFDEKTVNSYLAEYVAPEFSVSSGSAEIALNDLNNFLNVCPRA